MPRAPARRQLARLELTLKERSANPQQWCEVLILHLKTKHCRNTVNGGGKPQIEVRIGKKHDQALIAATHVAFAFRVPRTGLTPPRVMRVSSMKSTVPTTSR